MSASLTFLGTGHAMVTKCFNTCFVLEQDQNRLLVDAGGGNLVLTRLEQAEIPLSSIHHMFVTHTHTDHVLGVIWVIRKISTMMLNGQYDGTFTLYCHEEAAAAIETICRLTLEPKYAAPLGNRIRFHLLSHGEALEAAGFSLRFFDIGSTKTRQFGFQLRLQDGQSLVCPGDEPLHEPALPYARGCDWLLCEAFCLYEDREIFHPYEKHHSTALDTAKAAHALSVRNLVLYHTEDSCLAHRKERYTKEAQAAFSGRIFVPDDLEKIFL